MGTQLTREDVIAVAKQCFDPEIPVNIWDLGLIYDIDIPSGSDDVHIKMSLTSKACPAAQQIPEMLRSKLKVSGKTREIKIDLVFDPVWTPERISAEGKKKLGLLEE
ncbi:MAG: hypothetical protein A2Z83_07265 [Omnitrophica bacterium GWA2_52_8]|nr:MAG: hypothetical protein A2Z83_07265 [Omnitrophica bacterium GWA2_52_8]